MNQQIILDRNDSARVRAAQLAANEIARERLLSGPITSTLIVFSLPILGSTALQSLNLTVNQFWIARSLNISAITAVGNANVIMQLMLAAMFGMSAAANILIAQAVGAANWPMLKKVMGAAVSFFLMLSLVIAACGLLFSPAILGLIGTPMEARPQAILYLRVISVSLPFLLFFQFIQMAQQSAGDSRRPFYFMLAAIGIAIVLNPILIRGLGPIPKLGVAGAAFATCIGQASALMAMLVYLSRKHSPIMLRREDLAYLRPDREVLGAIVSRGIPITLQAVMWNASAAVMIGMVNSYGAVTAAAYTAASQLWNYVQMPAQALGAASTSMGAQNIGAGNWPRVDQVARSAVITALCFTGTVSILLYALGEHALHIFLPVGSPSVQVALHMDYLVLWSFALYSVTMQLIGIVRSTGAVMPPMITVFVALVCVRIAFAKLMQPFWGADAVWLSFPVGIFVSITMNSLYYRYGGWRKVRMLKSEPVSTEPADLPEAIAGTNAITNPPATV